MPLSAAAVASIHAEDVLVALGCELGDAAALRKLDRLCLVPAGEFLERRGLASGADDAIQDLRVRLLSPERGEPRITRYDGFGPLARWIQVAAVRTALNARRGERAEQPGHAELLERLTSSETDPEVHALRERHRGQLRMALEGALAALDPEARTLLRFHLVDGLSLGELSGIFGVHKSTLSRRVRSVQQAVLDLVRRSLIAEGIGADEIDSLWRALETDFELSVDRLLASDDGR
jgi:RNA polymerase sigma-70 factor (ECF subfamily)